MEQKNAIISGNSRVKPKESFSEKSYLVSLLNVGSILEGHSMILIEGLVPSPTTSLSLEDTPLLSESNTYSGTLFNNNANSNTPSLYIRQYDVFAEFNDDKEKLFNKKGYISLIRCFKSYGEKEYEKFTSSTWLVSRDNALEIAKSIEEDEKKMENEEKIPYHYLPKNHFLSSKDDDGMNCTEWCKLKLAAGGIKVKAKFDKDKPEKAAKGEKPCCTIV
jgi:hypothetical protein